ncbi:MAG: ISAs1 family transposase [Ketobacter sp.]|nr:ISAs1 family transposase [Ketobacter sp.]
MPIGNGSEQVKQTNEIKYAPILLDQLPIADKDITADALHTQTELADYLVKQRKAHYYFCVKKNQPTLFDDIEQYYSDQWRQADYEDDVCLRHGRIEQRRIWVTTDLSDYVDFPHVAQVYRIERDVTDKKSGETHIETAYGITCRTTEQASPKTMLHRVRGHWAVEVCHYVID